MFRKLKHANLKKKRSNISDKAIKAKGIISICLCLGIILKLGVPVSAEVSESDTYYEIGIGDNSYDYDNILSRYRTNGYLADENHSNINAQHLDILDRIEELEQAKEAKEALIEYKSDLLSQKTRVVTGSAITVDNTQELINEIDIRIMNIDSQLLQYNSTRSSVETNLSEAKLSRDISRFYKDYQSLIENEAKKKMESEFLKQCNSLLIYEKQLDYYEAYNEYLTLINKVDIIRYRYGLVTKTEADASEVSIIHNERIITENKYNFEAILKGIKKIQALQKN